MSAHRQAAESCWRIIKALATDPRDLGTLDAAVITLIEMACDSAVEAERARVATGAALLARGGIAFVPPEVTYTCWGRSNGRPCRKPLDHEGACAFD